MKTDQLRQLITSEAATLAASVVWPNALGFDTAGADGWTYSVSYDERRRLWVAAREGASAGYGVHPWSALANVTRDAATLTTKGNLQ